MNKNKLFNVLLSSAVVGQTVLIGIDPVNVLANQDTNKVVHEQLGDHQFKEPNKDEVLPSPYQYKYQKDELAAFCHFGPNTFNEIEWGESYGQKKPSEIFKLTEDFDAETLVKTLKDAGFKKLIVTAKHHDGFCIWASDATVYDVAATNYKNGKGDILAEISEACTKYNLDMGLYLSPWDIHDESYGYKDASGKALVKEVTQNGNKVSVPIDGYTWEKVKQDDAKDYNKYYNDQLIEILGNDKYGNHGHFTEVWMDGAKGSGANYQEYDFQKWFDTIQKYEGIEAKQPDDCLLFGAEAHTSVRWIGNEHGFAAEETWSKSKVDKEKNTINSNSKNGYTQGFVDGNQWTVPEADARITSGWFWGNTKKTPKSMEALSEMYFRSVGHNAPLLLNIPPNDKGKIDTAILNRVKEFGTNINKSFANNLAKDATVYANEVRGNDVKYSPNNLLDGKDGTYWTVNDNQNTGSITLKLPKLTKFDVVSIEESIEFGQRIGNYKVEYRKTGEEWKTFEEGKTVGAKRLCRNQAVEANEVRITVTADEKADVKVPMLSEVGLYKVTTDMALKNGIPQGLKTIDDRNFTQTGWNQESGDGFLEKTGMWTTELNKEASVKFHGTKVWLMGTVDPKHGTADIYIDGKKVKTIDTNATNRKLKQIIFESEDLSNQEHTLKIVNTGTGSKNAIGIDGIAYLDNGGKGALQIEYPNYRVNEDCEMPIVIKRVGGTSGEVKVQFQVNPGSAWQDHFDANGNMEVTFADGQKEAKAKIKTKRVPAKTGDLSFSIELVNPTGGAIVGYNSPANVVIADTEEFTKDALKAKIDEAKNANYVENQYTYETYQAFKDAMANAQKVYNMPNVSNQKYAEAAKTLDAAMHNLTKRTTFTENDPFIMPNRMNDKKVLEAEYAILDSSNAKNPDNYVRIEKDSNASNGSKVGWFEEGNRIEIPFVAAKPGTYKFSVTYQSGRAENNPNAINLSSESIEKPVSVDVHCKNGDTDGTQYQTVEFDVKVTKKGKGKLIFIADAKASPNIDKIEITAKDVTMDQFVITANAGKHGKISLDKQTTVTEGTDKKVTFTPDEGYTVKEVYVDGKSVGPTLEYTFENISSNHTIDVEFEKFYIDETNRFIFPTNGNTSVLEAERMQLHNTGPENEQYKLSVSTAPWASMGKFVNAMNSGDTIKLYYDAPQAGTYDVTVTYRSGSDKNSLSWEEKDQKIVADSETIGASNATVTKTKQFKFTVNKAGQGVITFKTGDNGAPQLDNLIITNNQIALQYDELGKAIADSKALSIDEYKDGEEKDLFKSTLQEAEVVLESARKGETSQEAIDTIIVKLNDARERLILKDQKPTVQKDELKSLVEKALCYKEEDYTLETFKNLQVAIAKSKEVLNNEEALQEDVDEAKAELQNAISKLDFISVVNPEKPNSDLEENKPIRPEEEKPVPEKSEVSTKPKTPANEKVNQFDVPNTGHATTALPFVGLLGSLAAILGIKREKNK